MRNSLNIYEQIDNYLSNNMSGEELTSFKNQLKNDAELQQMVESQQLLIQAQQRTILRAEIHAIAASGGFPYGKVLGGIGVVIVSIAMYFLIGNKPIAANKAEIAQNSEKTTIIEPLIESQEENTPKDSLSVDKIADTTAVLNAKMPISSKKKDYTYKEDTECGGHTTWVAPDVQKFIINPSKGATIEGKEGMLIIVPKDAFVDETGSLIKTPVELELVEALTLEDMVLYNLATVSNGKLLESGGMFYLDAKSNGKSVKINPERPFYIEIPTNETKKGMMAFEGEVDEAGNLNWVNPKSLKKYLVKMDLAQLDFLPKGFEGGVEAGLPFRNHKIATKELVDSLYYSLGGGEKEENDVITVIEVVDSASWREENEIISSFISNTQINNAPNLTIRGQQMMSQMDEEIRGKTVYFLKQKYYRVPQNKWYTISGKVIDQNGKEVRDAIVEINYNNILKISSLSDNLGRFNIQVPTANVNSISATFKATDGTEIAGKNYSLQGKPANITLTINYNYIKDKSLQIRSFQKNSIASNSSIKGKVLTYKGKVKQRNLEPCPFVNVALYQNGKLITGATTDFDGMYKIDAPAGEYVLQAKFVGYNTYVQENIEMKENSLLSFKDVILTESGKFDLNGASKKYKVNDKLTKEFNGKNIVIEDEKGQISLINCSGDVVPLKSAAGGKKTDNIKVGKNKGKINLKNIEGIEKYCDNLESLIPNPSTNNNLCGINPLSIKTIKTNNYQETFVATKEFEKRVAVLHQMDNGQELLDIYLSHLGKDLYISDSLVASKLTGNYNKIFTTFYNQKLTNLEDANIHQEQLSVYYNKKRKEYAKSIEKLRKELASKDRKEIEALQNRLVVARDNYISSIAKPDKKTNIRQNRSIEKIMNKLPKTNAVNSNVYAITWTDFDMGWANIDRFRNSGSTEAVTFEVKLDSFAKEKVSVSLLVPNKRMFIPSFKMKKGNYSFTHGEYEKKSTLPIGDRAFVCATYSEGSEKYFAIKEIILGEAEVELMHLNKLSEQEIKQKLRKLGFDRKPDQNKRDDFRKQLSNQKRLKVQKEKLAKERKERAAIFKKIQQEYEAKKKEIYKELERLNDIREAERCFIESLMDIAFPCREGHVEQDIAESDDVVDSEGDSVLTTYVTPEIPPSFTGGEKAMYVYLAENVIYPKMAYDTGIEGKVYVQFVVKEDGAIGDVLILKKAHPLLDKEAIRVVKNMPKWNPGSVNGKITATQFTLPIVFKTE